MRRNRHALPIAGDRDVMPEGLGEYLVVRSHDETGGGAFPLVEKLARRGKVAPLRAHPEEDETFYALEGEVLVHFDGSERSLGPGGFISVSRSLPHVLARPPFGESGA